MSRDAAGTGEKSLPPPRLAGELVPCAEESCFNFFAPALVRQKDGSSTPKSFCSRACAGRATRRRVNAELGRRAGDKRRGSNPNRHIQIRVGGRLKYLHRHTVETQMGVKLAHDEIVHHRDLDKHHNCFWKDARSCERCRREGEPNLEVLTGEARREHIERHQRQMQTARRKRRR